jgi:hypothetical protein
VTGGDVLGLLDVIVSALGLDKIALEALQPVFVELDELKIIIDENNIARKELLEVLEHAVLE